MNRVRLLILALGMALVVPLTAGTAWAAPTNGNEATASQPIQADGAGAQGFLTFGSPSDVFRFTVDLEAGFTGTTLAVDTRDCCLVGDRWGVSIILPGTPVIRTACGTGSTVFFTGLAHLGTARNPLTDSATVQVFYCGGTDVFPGSVEVRVRYNGDGITVTRDMSAPTPRV